MTYATINTYNLLEILHCLQHVISKLINQQAKKMRLGSRIEEKDITL